MIVAKTKEESDLLCEQEISHILRLDDNPKQYVPEEKTNITKQCFFELPERVSLTTIKTKKYGTLVLFDRIADLIESRFNKCVLAVYCENRSIVKKRDVVVLSTTQECYSFENREFSNNGGVYLNNIETMEPQSAYLIIIERNKYANNSVQIIDNFKLKGNG